MGLFRKIIFTIRAKIFRTRKNLPGSNATLLPVILGLCLFYPYAIEIFYAFHRLLVNIFADLRIDNAESTQLVYNSGQKLLVCSFWY